MINLKRVSSIGEVSKVDEALDAYRQAEATRKALPEQMPEDLRERYIDAELDAIFEFMNAKCETARDVRVKAQAMINTPTILEIFGQAEDYRSAFLTSLVKVGA